jgi:serpin B
MTPLDARFVEANTRFGLKLFSEIERQAGESNRMISPASVAIALSMTYNGAQGETQRSMAQALELQGLDLNTINQANATLKQSLEQADPAVTVAIANSLWGRLGIPFKDEFLQRNREFYQAEVSTLDFASADAADTINCWVSRNTRGKIPQIVSEINPDDVLFLINAVYFKGNWTTAFKPEATVERPFHRADGTSNPHPLMTQHNKYRYLETSYFQAISLPYGNERLSMYVFLPQQNSNLNRFLQTLTPQNWNTWISQFRQRDGVIQLPKFKLDYELGLNTVLKTIGMASAFDTTKADFSGISTQPTHINQVQHKTFIEVNEEGTEAAATTSVRITVTSAMPAAAPFQMIVDRPFFFAIRDNQTGIILFMGTVLDPT